MKVINQWKHCSVVILMFIIGAVSIASGQNDVGTKPRPKLPDITLKTLDGEGWKLSGSLEKTLILNFWATWCEPCRSEIPYLLELSQEFKESGLLVAGVNLDKETDGRVQRFIKEFKIDYPILQPPVGSPFWEMEELPATLLIDSQGRLVKRYTGAVPEAELRRDVGALLPATKTAEPK